MTFQLPAVENNSACKFRKKSTLLLCSTVYNHNKLYYIARLLHGVLSSLRSGISALGDLLLKIYTLCRICHCSLLASALKEVQEGSGLTLRHSYSSQCLNSRQNPRNHVAKCAESVNNYRPLRPLVMCFNWKHSVLLLLQAK